MSAPVPGKETQMASTSVRVDPKLHATLRKLAEAEHRPIGKVIEDAVARYEKDKFWQEMREGFATQATGMAQIVALLTKITGSPGLS